MTTVGLGLFCAASLCLAGCVEQVATAKPEVAAIQKATNMARRAGVSPGGATVALASLNGAPQDVADRFTQVFAREARGREIAMAPSASAHYIVRGYLDAAPTATGADITYVWDVFDSSKNRAQRVSDSIALTGKAADPWSIVDDKALSSVAAKAADDLAAFLTNTPEAVAAAASPNKALASAAPAGGVSVAPMSAPAKPAAPRTTASLSAK